MLLNWQLANILQRIEQKEFFSEEIPHIRQIAHQYSTITQGVSCAKREILYKHVRERQNSN